MQDMKKSSELHVLVIPSWYPSNSADPSGSFFREQVQCLSGEGVKVGVLVNEVKSIKRFFDSPMFTSDISHEKDSEVNVCRSRATPWFFFSPNLTARLWEKRVKRLYEAYVLRHGKPDLIHAHCMLYAGWAARHIKSVTGIPFVVTEHSSRYALRKTYRAQSEMVKEVIAQASQLISVGSVQGELLRNKFHVAGRSWLTVPNMANKNFLEQELCENSGSNHFTFCTVSLMTKNKNVALLIKSFYAAYSRNNNLRLRIGGSGVERANLERLVCELNISEFVTFAGTLARDKVASFISECDAFVLSSNYETFGVVLIEAIALGKPVITTDCGGSTDIVNQNNGIIVPVENPEILGQALFEMAVVKDNFSAQDIRDDCLNRFGCRAISTSLKGIYGDVLG
jgi:glycosyltransferase involved in cell wall biosynthesis